MATLSTSAWVLHELGMAAGFGGTLFGKAALDPAVREIRAPEERGKVMHGAWSRYHLINAIALGTMAATWIAGRGAISGRGLGRPMRRLITTKDLLTCAAVAAGVSTMLAGRELERRRHQTGAGTTTAATAKLERFLSAMGPITAAIDAGLIGVTAALAQEAGKSSRWGFVARLLP